MKRILFLLGILLVAHSMLSQDKSLARQLETLDPNKGKKLSLVGMQQGIIKGHTSSLNPLNSLNPLHISHLSAEIQEKIMRYVLATSINSIFKEKAFQQMEEIKTGETAGGAQYTQTPIHFYDSQENKVIKVGEIRTWQESFKPTQHIINFTKESRKYTVINLPASGEIRACCVSRHGDIAIGWKNKDNKKDYISYTTRKEIADSQQTAMSAQINLTKAQVANLPKGAMQDLRHILFDDSGTRLFLSKKYLHNLEPAFGSTIILVPLPVNEIYKRLGICKGMPQQDGSKN